jgi:hypothetical protein
MQTCEELCISRAIDRAATAEDWRALEHVAAADPDVWRRLCRTLQEETLLGQRVDALLPAPALPESALFESARLESAPLAPPVRATTARRARIGPWLAAALLLLAFWCGRVTAVPTATTTTPATAGTTDAPAADELLFAYLEEGTRSGRVIEQLPPRTLATRRLPDDQGLEVVFVRSLVERTRVDRAVTLASDEHGRPTPLVVDLARYLPPTDY